VYDAVAPKIAEARHAAQSTLSHKKTG